MASDKMKEMIEKLTKQKAKPKAEVKAEPNKVEEPVVEPAPIPAPEPAPVKELPQDDGTIAPPVENKKPTEEQIRQLITQRIEKVRDVGIFRLELLGEVRGVTEELKLLNEILGKLLE